MKRLLVLAAAVVGLLAVWPARADERVERFLPADTMFFGGVAKLGPGFDKVLGALRRALPFAVKELDEGRAIRELAEEWRLDGVRTRDDLLAATGLDPDGSAGIAWALWDPSYRPFDGLNEDNFVLVLPVRDAARAERLAAERLLPEFLHGSRGLCRSAISRIEAAKYAWKERHPDRADATPTWDDLASANPGLKPLLCPAGGEYTIGTLKEQPACSLHKGGAAPRPEGPLTREQLGERKVGDVTLVGGRNKGTGYALAAGHIVLSNNMNVLEAAVAAAAGGGPRARLAPQPAGAADGRAYLQLRVLFAELRHEVQRWQQREGSVAAPRLLKLLDSAGGITADVRLDAAVAAALSWAIERNEATQPLLDTPPAKLEALGLVPDSALLAVGGNIAHLVFRTIADLAALGDDREPMQLHAVTRLLAAASAGDGAFALTRDSFGREMPFNLLFILRVRDAETMRATIEVLANLVTRAGRREKAVHERVEAGGAEVWQLGQKEEGVVYYAFLGPFVAAATKLDDLKAAIELQAGRGKDALLAGERFRRLELPEGPANLVAVLDMPALILQATREESRRRIEMENQACLANLQRNEQVVEEYRKEKGQLPPSIEELRGFARDPKRRRYFPEQCVGHRAAAKFAYDPATGKFACPRHGTAAEFKPTPPDVPRRLRPEEMTLAAFGVSALRLRIEGARLVGEGRLAPAPQQVPQAGEF